MDFNQTFMHIASLGHNVKHPSGSLVISVMVPEILCTDFLDGRQHYCPLDILQGARISQLFLYSLHVYANLSVKLVAIIDY